MRDPTINQDLIDDLPALLRDIARATDVKTALVIAENFGGRMLYLPRTVRDGSPLARLIGRKRAQQVADMVNAGIGDGVLIPLGPYASRAQRWRKMRRMIDEKHSRAQIAAACGLHQRTVQRHRRGAQPAVRASLRQGDFFD